MSVPDNSGGVKARRAYTSPRRQQQAALTRRSILDAARRQFERLGYSATALGDVATEAQVALKTVQALFGTKRQLLLAVWHWVIAGEDDDTVPVAQREWFRHLLGEADPLRQIELLARSSRSIKGRAAGLMEAVRNAAPAEPEIAELWNRLQGEFLENQTAVARSIAAKGVLRDGMSAEEAGQRLWLLNHASTYRLATTELGWSPERYERWLVGAVRDQLLGPD